MADRIQFWSNGGGVQSAAIAALIVQKKLPKPDLIAIADTERERSNVWEYLDQVIRPALRNIGLQIYRVKKSDFVHHDLWVDWGVQEKPTTLMPVFIANPDGSTGRLQTFCSQRWKRRVMQRWLRGCGVKKCDCWIGYSLDEMRRVRTSDELWYQYRYPLVFDVPMRRSECIRVVESMGWPEPPRSACYQCPNRMDSEWSEMKRNAPEDFSRAVALEKEMQKTRSDFFLHRSLRPLDLIDFDGAQLSMITGDTPNSCTEGCFT
jgi:hypothetical protein